MEADRDFYLTLGPPFRRRLQRAAADGDRTHTGTGRWMRGRNSEWRLDGSLSPAGYQPCRRRLKRRLLAPLRRRASIAANPLAGEDRFCVDIGGRKQTDVLPRLPGGSEPDRRQRHGGLLRPALRLQRAPPAHLVAKQPAESFTVYDDPQLAQLCSCASEADNGHWRACAARSAE